MTTSTTATLPLVLSSGRAVSVGDLLTADEARDVIILQRGTAPLRPMPLDADLYEVAQSDSMPVRLVLAELFTTAPALIVNELQASVLADAWSESVDPGLELPIPIGDGRFVPRYHDWLDWQGPFDDFLAWHSDWTLRMELLSLEANKNPRGIA